MAEPGAGGKVARLLERPVEPRRNPRRMGRHRHACQLLFERRSWQTVTRGRSSSDAAATREGGCGMQNARGVIRFWFRPEVAAHDPFGTTRPTLPARDSHPPATAKARKPHMFGAEER